MTWHPPLVTLEAATEREAKEFAEKGMRDHLLRGRFALTAGSPPAWAPQHPPPPPGAPPRCRILLRSILHILRVDPFYNNRASAYEANTPLTLIPTPVSDDSIVSVLIHTLHLFEIKFLQWIFSFLHIPEPDSYPTYETPTSTPEGPTTINVAERRRWRRKEQMKNADLINFF